MKEQVDNATERLRIAQGQLDLATSDAEAIKEVAELRAEVSQKAVASLKLNRTLEAEIQSLQKRERAEQAKWAKEKQAERERETAEKQKQREADEQRLEAELQAIADFESKKKELQDILDLENTESEKEKDLLKQEQDAEKRQAELDEMVLNNQQKQELETLLAEQNELEKQAIVDKYNEIELKKQDEQNTKKLDAEKRLAAEILSAKMNQLNQDQEIANNLGTIAKGVFGENKALNAAMALTNTYFTAQKAYQSQFMPVPDPTSPVRGSIAAAAAIAAGLSRVKAITSVKAEKGMLLQGKTHNQGGINIEAEGGEAIINKRSTALFKPLLSDINEAGGGVAFMEQGGIAGGLDTANESTFQSIDITSQMSNLKVINVASETAEVYDDVMKVENLANV